jgi:hypothetical protein
MCALSVVGLAESDPLPADPVWHEIRLWSIGWFVFTVPFLGLIVYLFMLLRRRPPEPPAVLPD